ncbi:MAG: Clp protease [Dactylosporangium sp.]|nr:Clp protease [Dactylosporangium sp.]NNJ59924.1 Clp protease [Dactylosporangium sp.]
MFERFTDQARSVIVSAQDQAARLHHRHIGTEHLLLALLITGDVARTVLTEAGVDTERVRDDVKRHLRTGFDVLGAADAEALRSIGIDLDAVRAKVEETFGPNVFEVQAQPRRRWPFGRRLARHRPFTPRARKALELSLREALHLKHNYIGTEHLLLGLLRERGGLAARILAEQGYDFDDLRTRTVAAIQKAS